MWHFDHKGPPDSGPQKPSFDFCPTGSQFYGAKSPLASELPPYGERARFRRE